jgi:uncharacterized protein YciI
MQFVLICRDGADDKALDRRLAARAAHIAMGDEAVKRNEQLVGAAMLNDAGAMCGSVMIVDFPSRKELDDWLKVEPYVIGGVWKDIEIIPCKIGPSFMQRFQK